MGARVPRKDSDELLPLIVPLLAGSRAQAQLMLAALLVDLCKVTVRLQADLLIAASAAFADEVVLRVLVDGRADRLEIAGLSNARFAAALRERAEVHGVGQRLRLHCAPRSGDYLRIS